MENTLKELKEDLLKLINIEMNIQSKKVDNSDYDKRYWRSFGRTVAFSKVIGLIEEKEKMLK